MNNTLHDLLRAATRLTQAGRLNEATEAIQRALGGATRAGAMGVPRSAAASSATASLVLDGCVVEVDTPPPAAAATAFAAAPMGGPFADPLPARLTPTQDAVPAAARSGPGAFGNGTHTHSSLTRRYRLYVPPGQAGQPLPLVVMLHGCTQNPEDFAAGTGMNERAREQGFYVLYPEQSQDANPQRCWNWFKHNHQQRGSGEPAVIAEMTHAVMKQHGIDPRRVYIAGLSAGGAMAALVAAAYPEVFAAVGVHSGLPCGTARSVPEALALMNSGTAGSDLRARAGRFGAAPAAVRPLRPVPTIVFHGDQDRTVHPRNGEQVIAAVLDSITAAGNPQVEQGLSPNGRRYTRSTHHGDQGNALAEHWLVHGAGHAWSGGHATGSYTDARGPDATGEMLRFFFEHPHKPRP